jgi:hypothetical protein
MSLSLHHAKTLRSHSIAWTSAEFLVWTQKSAPPSKLITWRDTLFLNEISMPKKSKRLPSNAENSPLHANQAIPRPSQHSAQLQPQFIRTTNPSGSNALLRSLTAQLHAQSVFCQLDFVEHKNRALLEQKN